jgi:uncharacterized protein DUF929
VAKRTAAANSARAKAAQVRAEQERAVRRRRLLQAGAAVVAVLVVIGALLGFKLINQGSPAAAPRTTPTGPASSPAAAAVVSKVASVPAATLNSIGVGTAGNLPAPVKAPELTADGKPRILYIGAEYCPYCAAQRWAMVQALSRFGTWSGVGLTHSGTNDVFPDTPTLTFHGATYSSKYVSFTGVETSSNQPQGNGYAPLDKMSPADGKIYTTYNQTSYTGQQAGSIPFVDIAGRYLNVGASYSPQLLAGMTHQQVAAALSDPHSAVAQAVDGTANAITAAICQATGGKPSSVCTAPGVKAAGAKLAPPK